MGRYLELCEDACVRLSAPLPPPYCVVLITANNGASACAASSRSEDRRPWPLALRGTSIGNGGDKHRTAVRPRTAAPSLCPRTCPSRAWRRHEAEERLRADRANANEIIDLLDLSETGAPRVRLAAVQSCRAVFTEWAASGTLVLSLAADDPTSTGASEGESPRLAFRRWVLEQYAHDAIPCSSERRRPGCTPALDSLVQTAEALQPARPTPPLLRAQRRWRRPPGGPLGARVGAERRRWRTCRSSTWPTTCSRDPAPCQRHRRTAARRAVRPASAARCSSCSSSWRRRADPRPRPCCSCGPRRSDVGRRRAEALTAKKHRFELARCWRALLAPRSRALYQACARYPPPCCRTWRRCSSATCLDGYARAASTRCLPGSSAHASTTRVPALRAPVRLLAPGMLDGEHNATPTPTPTPPQPSLTLTLPLP